MHKASFALFDHPADIGVRAWAPTIGGAFMQAARGLYAVILGRPDAGAGADSAEVAGPKDVEVEGEDWAELLVNWLAELLYLFDVEGFVATGADLRVCWPPRFTARLQGCLLPDPGAAGVAVKAVTYHQLVVDPTPGRARIEVILDI